MALPCPICKTTFLEPFTVNPNLSAPRCPTCLGIWITSVNYFGYLALPQTDASGIPENVPPRVDSPSLKMCPACGKFMHYYPVGRGIPFGIDKCNTCGGVWLNDGEWTALHARSLHTKLHAISSDTWQDQVQDEKKAAAERAAMLQRLGEKDLAELDRVAEWIATHPRRDVLISYFQGLVRKP